jgi:hypothetical protein
VSDHRPVTGSALRRFTLGSGPLKRTSDRLQHLSRILLVCVLLTGVAVALAVGTATYTQGRAEASAQVAARHQVTAHLVEDARPPEADAGSVAARGSASVRWSDVTGTEHHAVVSVPTTAKAGAMVLLWIDREGNRTTTPLTSGDAASTAIGYGLLTYMTISLVAVACYRAFRGSLDRGRARRWEAEWAVVEPVWSRTVP